MSFSPDGRNVLTSSRDGTAIIWLAADWRGQRDVRHAAASKQQRELATRRRGVRHIVSDANYSIATCLAALLALRDFSPRLRNPQGPHNRYPIDSMRRGSAPHGDARSRATS